MSNKPLVSYTVTAYNSGDFIKEAVECAFAQTYSPLEIVLSDDCSTDNTFEIMSRMASEYNGPHKIKLNRNEKNLGITKHMNKVFLDLAQGEFIVVAHADDISLPERSDILVSYLQQHPNCTKVSNSFIKCDENKNPLNACLQRNNQVQQKCTYKLGSGAHTPTPSCAFRKKIMTFFGPLNDSCPTEDDTIGFRAILLGEIAFLPNILSYYRKHTNSNSHPDKFLQFPLDEIFNQNIKDMKFCLKKGMITEAEYDQEKDRLYRSKELRKVYRVYFAKRNFISFFKLITYHDLKFRRRLSYIREHFNYLLGNYEKN